MNAGAASHNGKRRTMNGMRSRIPPGGTAPEQASVVLFDAGGTLITIDYERLRGVLAAGGRPPDDGEFERAEGIARTWADTAVRRRLAPRELWDGYFGRLLENVGVEPDTIPGALERLWQANRELGLWRRPVPDALPLLQRVARAGRRMAVISNAEGQVEGDLRAAGFGEYLETVVDSHLVGVAKPDPRIFTICLERLGATPGQCVYVGDVPAFDVVGARAAGITPILLDPWDIHAALDGEVFRVRSLAEVALLLRV